MTTQLEGQPELSSSEQLSVQQQLVLEQQYKALERFTQTGDHLDGKAMAIFQAGSLIITLTSAVSLPAFVSQPATLPMRVGLIIAFGAYLLMLLLALLAWLPSKSLTPGTPDWDNLFREYLYQDATTCFDKVLSNIVDSSAAHIKRNKWKANCVRGSAILLAVQIAGILVLALAA